MAAGALTDAVVEEVAVNLEEAAEITRKIDTKGVGFFLGGVSVGVAIGFYFGYRFNREKIKAEAFKESREEVEQIREVYQQKIVAAQQKRSVNEIIEEKGYAVEASPEKRLLPPPVPMSRNEPQPTDGPDYHAEHAAWRERQSGNTETWDYPAEMAQRTPDEPYVIHQEEFNEEEPGYPQVTYTYYATDDVLTGEDDIPVPHADIVVGQTNLKFGHGTDDENVVYVRNDKLELEMEICRSPGSYEIEVLGLEHSDTYENRHPNRQRNRDDSD